MSGKAEGAAVAAAGAIAAAPLASDYVIIFIWAFIGALGALSKQGDISRSASFWFIFRSLTIATVMSSLVATWASEKTGYDFYLLLSPVALVLAWQAEKFPAIMDKATEWLLSKVGIK